MLRTLLVTVFLITAVGCTSKPPPPPAKNYKLEALQNDAVQITRFIDNWSGFDQQYSRINNLEEYQSVKRKIKNSPEYSRFKEKSRFESKTNQFDAIVKRYEIWVEERSKQLAEMDSFFQRYKNKQHQLFATHVRPLVVGSYEIAVANAYYAMAPNDPDQAYASARHIGLKQLDIIAASRDKPLRLPIFNTTDFVVDIQITNRSKDKILRPNGFIHHQQNTNSKAGVTDSRSYNKYLVFFSDDRTNRYQFNRAYGVINKHSENGIRPGESMIWTYSFNSDNHPLETVKMFQISYPKQVFGRSFKLSIPIQVILKPELPESFHTRQPGSS